MAAMNEFEERYYDEYEYYNIMSEQALSGSSSRKGRSKTEANKRRYIGLALLRGDKYYVNLSSIL